MKHYPKKGSHYRWINQPEKLVYIGIHRDHVHCRGWYQFAKVDEPSVVWCEVRPEDLEMLEEIPNEETGGAAC